MRCQDKFVEMYRKLPEGMSFCPYRVCPLGAHVDHQHGKVTGFAIDKGVHVAYSVKHNGVVELLSLQFEKRAQFHVASVPEKPQGDWADYLRGATLALSRRHRLYLGMSAVIEGTLPIGGLSSSAAVIISFLEALSRVNSLDLSWEELIAVALEAENAYVGVSCGKLDQSCEILSRKDHLLYLDTRDGTYELIPASPLMRPYRIAIFFSGIERTLAGSKFNMRVDECRSAAYALMAFSGMEYGKFSETVLRDVPYETFLRFRDRLPEPWRLRAEHFYSEQRRVEQGAEAWRKGDILTYGRLSFESGHSSIFQWQTGSDELRTLYEVMCHTDGVFGGRFSGAGFKGCCMALIDPSFQESVIQKVSQSYLQAFPELRERFSVHVCQTSDGILSQRRKEAHKAD